MGGPALGSGRALPGGSGRRRRRRVAHRETGRLGRPDPPRIRPRLRPAHPLRLSHDDARGGGPRTTDLHGHRRSHPPARGGPAGGSGGTLAADRLHGADLEQRRPPAQPRLPPRAGRLAALPGVRPEREPGVRRRRRFPGGSRWRNRWGSRARAGFECTTRRRSRQFCSCGGSFVGRFRRESVLDG